MNQNEFMQLVNPFKDKLFRVAKRLLVSTEEAEDATQEVLVKLWNRNEILDEYKSVEALGGVSNYLDIRSRKPILHLLNCPLYRSHWNTKALVGRVRYEFVYDDICECHRFLLR